MDKKKSYDFFKMKQFIIDLYLSFRENYILNSLQRLEDLSEFTELDEKI